MKRSAWGAGAVGTVCVAAVVKAIFILAKPESPHNDHAVGGVLLGGAAALAVLHTAWPLVVRWGATMLGRAAYSTVVLLAVLAIGGPIATLIVAGFCAVWTFTGKREMPPAPVEPNTPQGPNPLAERIAAKRRITERCPKCGQTMAPGLTSGTFYCRPCGEYSVE